MSTFIQQLLIWIIPLLFAITLHEVAHGWIASLLGDPTAKMLGRLTINPFKHIDPIGTVLVPLTLLFLGGFVFGWAKPVPVTNENFKNKYRDMALVAIAGPLANLCMAIGWAICAKLALMFGGNNDAGEWTTFGLSLYGTNWRFNKRKSFYTQYFAITAFRWWEGVGLLVT